MFAILAHRRSLAELTQKVGSSTKIVLDHIDPIKDTLTLSINVAFFTCLKKRKAKERREKWNRLKHFPTAVCWLSKICLLLWYAGKVNKLSPAPLVGIFDQRRISIFSRRRHWHPSSLNRIFQYATRRTQDLSRYTVITKISIGAFGHRAIRFSIPVCFRDYLQYYSVVPVHAVAQYVHRDESNGTSQEIFSGRESFRTNFLWP